MEFRVLGSLEVVAGGQALGLGTPRQRTLLALLLVQAGGVVSYDRLVEDLWDGDPPATARHTLQGYVHRLRRTLGADGWRLTTRPPGYQLKVSTGELDAQRIQDQATAGRRALVRDHPQAAADQLAAGLSLWRGPLLADLDEVAALEPERARLEALRLTALEDRIEADLALAGHGGLVAELEGLVADHPYWERLWGQLMLALYRSGRQADALQAFHRARHVLDEDLGIEPSRWLRRRQEQILLQDPVLEAPDPTPPPRPPHHLPAQRTSFVGRRRELAELQGLLQARRLVCYRSARVEQDPPGRRGRHLPAGGLPARRLVRVAGRGHRSRAGPLRCGHRPGSSGAARTARRPGAHRPPAVKAAAAVAGQLRTPPASSGRGRGTAGCRPRTSGAGDQPDAAAAVRRAGVPASSSPPAPARRACHRPRGQ